MRIIVIGAGDVGYHIAERLVREQHEVTVIEKDAQSARRLRGKLDALVIDGNGASIEVLERAGIARAGLFIAVTNQDEVNLIACLLANNYNVPRIVARIRTLQYSKSEWKRNAEKLGISLMINPESVVAEEIVHSVSYTAAAEVAEFAGGRVVFLGYPIGADSPLIGISMRTLGAIRGLYRMIVTGISRDGRTIIPHGEDVVQLHDTLYFVCNKRDLPAVTELFGFAERETKNVFVLGGSHVGSEVASRLAAMKYRVKLVERDPELCQELAAKLEAVRIFNTTGTDIDTLINEGLQSADVFIAVTHDDESNILCSLLAKRHGAKRAIALVNQPKYVSLTPALGLDVCISPRLATASAILKYVRRAEVVSMAVIEQSDSEVIEFSLHAGSPALGRPLKLLNMPEGAIVGAIVRADQAIVPAGDDEFLAGDHVVVFSLPEAVPEVSRFFS
jgi:trk system potassium uptake protein TrkA